MRYDPTIFTIPEGINQEEWVVASYYMEAETEDLLLRSQAMAVEQSTGTWTAVPEETEEVKERHIARIIGVHEIPDYEYRVPKEASSRRFIVQVAYPERNIGRQIPELLTTLYGNISMIEKLKLFDVSLPRSFVQGFTGPKFGIEGIRRLLGVPRRPLVCGMFKPCVGASPATLGKMFYEMALGGIDIVKDDELLADPAVCPVMERLEECMKAEEKARRETGRHVLYAINITDSPRRIWKKAEAVIHNGGNALMINTYTVGYATVADLAEDPAITVPILTHPAMAGSLFEAPEYGMTSTLVLGKFPRLAGSDMVIYPGPYGKVPLVRERAVRVAHELTSPFYHLKRTFPGPAAGMHPGLVGRMCEDFGWDLLFGAGGGIHGHPDGTIAGVTAFHQAIEAAMAGIPLARAADTHKELRAALEKWGTYEDALSNYGLTK